MHAWRLDDGHQTVVLAARGNRLPEVIYWGAALPASESLDALVDASSLDITGGMLDENPDLSICPETARTFPGQPGLIAHAVDGTPIHGTLLLESADADDDRIDLTYRDAANGMTYLASLAMDSATRVITASAKLRSDKPVRVLWLAAPVMPAAQHSDEMIDVSGRWCGEFQLNRTPWIPGIRLRENRTGRSGHEHFPGLFVPARGATNTQGEAWAFHYGWSGGHRMVAEELPDGRRQVQFGHATGIDSRPGLEFETAPLYLAYSRTGLNGCAVSFQRHVRDHVVTWPKPERPRPLHYNCWEAVYFDHKPEVLKDIAGHAARLGAERFVLDDGWFDARNDDTSSIPDWDVDRRKFPDGLEPLIKHVHGLGMTFGIWFEPEMINPDSGVYRKHPDWAFGPSDQILGRQQMALDMSNAAVREHAFAKISAILNAHDIDYIKWDHNRVLPVPDHAQAKGTHVLMGRLREAFPDVEIETCASGGGRLDLGILSHTQRAWLSDSNDALERLAMQHNAALFLPAAVTGSHVGPRVSHTSGRSLDIRFRAWVAASRHMGIEMDPRELTEDETEVLAKVIAWWKSNRHWMMQADILRLDSADPAIIAEMHISADRSRFAAFIGKSATSAQILPRPIRLADLDPNASYRVELANRDDTVRLSRGNMALKGGPLMLSGRFLVSKGLTLPWSYPASLWVIEGSRL